MTDLVSPAGSIVAVQKFEGLQLEPPKRDIVHSSDGSNEPITKEEEIIKKKKTELTTTRQIETRVKRQVVLEDGKVIEDSGPMVETNTTEDTEKQESESTEKRNLGDDADSPKAIEGEDAVDGSAVALADASGRIVRAIVSGPDGLVREVKEKKVVSREEIQELVETEDVRHLGSFSDEAYVNAVNSGVENIEAALLSDDAQKALIPTGPRVVHQSTKAHKTVDTEDTDLKCLAQADGTLVTEKKKTTEHEEFFDEDLPEEDDHSTGSREKIEHTESSQRFAKQRDEQIVEYVADGKVIGKEMRYASENQQMERDGPKENASDWDSLSERVRKQKRQQKSLLQMQKEALMAHNNRRDVLRSIDFDREEESRKVETMKWLENHFGSESRSSLEDDENDESTKKSFFNVTIKSNPTTPTTTKNFVTATPYVSAVRTTSKKAYDPNHDTKREKPQSNAKKSYFQGVSDWSERKETHQEAPRFAATKTFYNELQGTIERKRQERQRLASAVEQDIIPRKENVIYTKSANGPVYGTSRTESKFRRNSRAESDDAGKGYSRSQKEDLGYLSGSKSDLRVKRDPREEIHRQQKRQDTSYLRREDSGFINSNSRDDIRYVGRNGRENSFVRSGDDTRDFNGHIRSTGNNVDKEAMYSTKYNKKLSVNNNNSPDEDDNISYPEEMPPIVPRRRKVLERQMQVDRTNKSPSRIIEPPPDYPQHGRSRSTSPTRYNEMNGDARKQPLRTRFSAEPNSNEPINHQTQIIQTKTNKVGSAIGNSIRKLVGKIRSASAERKMKAKSKRSVSPHHSSHTFEPNGGTVNGGSTYQQYNVIDGHIGRQTVSALGVSDRTERRNRPVERRASADVEMGTPKQRYYLGEDPYGGSIFGRENKYEGARPQRYQRNHRADDPDGNYWQQNTTTLGRFSKSSNRLNSAPPGEDGFRSTQTLPRKLEHRPTHSSTINVSIVNNVKPSQIFNNTGPAKPARTYKSLNRSKSFNVHGLNGTNDPNPVYIERVHRKYSNSLHKSNPQLNEDKVQLKSPSIVNLISRSQKDLTTIDEDQKYSKYSLSGANGHQEVYDKKSMFLKGLQSQAPELYKELHGDDENRKLNGHKYPIDRNLSKERESSLGSRSPITINKDTASIIRRGSSSTDDYSEVYKITSKSDDPLRPSVTNSVHSFSKKTLPAKNGRGFETIESSERKSVTTSRYTGEPNKSNIKYLEEKGPVRIEVRTGK